MAFDERRTHENSDIVESHGFVNPTHRHTVKVGEGKHLTELRGVEPIDISETKRLYVNLESVFEQRAESDAINRVP